MSSDVPMNGASFPSAHSHPLNGAVLATQTVCTAAIFKHTNRYYYTCEGLALTLLILSLDYLKSSPKSNL